MAAPVYGDRVQETFTTTGTGTISLGGAVSGYQAFSSALSDGQTVYYAATDGTNWEVGLGTYTASGATLARTTILSSSNSNAAVNWASGTKNIWLDLPAAVLKNFTASGIAGTILADNASAGIVGEFIAASTANTTAATVTMTIASPCVVTWSGHPFRVDSAHNFAMPIVFSTGGTLPTGVTAGTPYWVIGSSVTSTTFQIATSIANALAGIAINTSGSQSGTQTATPSFPLANNVTADIGAISVPAGDFDLYSLTTMVCGGSTVCTQSVSGTQTTSATIGTGPGTSYGLSSSFTGATGEDFSLNTGPLRANVNAATTYYLSVYATFSVSTLKAIPFFGGRRIR